jgi:hypothetical protein
MKAGGTLVLDLHELSVDWEGKVFADKLKGAVPSGLFSPAAWEDASKTVFVRTKGDGPAACQDGFGVVLVAHAPFADFESRLRASLNFAWDFLEPIVVGV